MDKEEKDKDKPKDEKKPASPKPVTKPESPATKIKPSKKANTPTGTSGGAAKPTNAVSKASSTKPDGGLSVLSDTPTALVAPSDYEHIFSNDRKPPNATTDSCKKANNRIPSDAPTVLLVQINESKQLPQKEAKKKKVTKDRAKKEKDTETTSPTPYTTTTPPKAKANRDKKKKKKKKTMSVERPWRCCCC